MKCEGKCQLGKKLQNQENSLQTNNHILEISTTLAMQVDKNFFIISEPLSFPVQNRMYNPITFGSTQDYSPFLIKPPQEA